jgi:hypothetical protein
MHESPWEYSRERERVLGSEKRRKYNEKESLVKVWKEGRKLRVHAYAAKYRVGSLILSDIFYYPLQATGRVYVSCIS